MDLQIIHDVNCLALEVCGDYLGQVLQILSSCSAAVLDLVKQSILHGGKSLEDFVPLVINIIIEALVEKSVEVSYNLSMILSEITLEGVGVLLFICCFKYFLDCNMQ